MYQLNWWIVNYYELSPERRTSVSISWSRLRVVLAVIRPDRRRLTDAHVLAGFKIITVTKGTGQAKEAWQAQDAWKDPNEEIEERCIS